MIFVSCKDSDISPSLPEFPSNDMIEAFDDYFYDCEFIDLESNDVMWTSLEEIAIIEYCEENEIETVGEIKSSLIGEWELVGHSNGDGYLLGLHNQPCVYFWIEEKDMVIHFEDFFLDTIFRARWDIAIGEFDHTLVFDNEIFTLTNIKMFSDKYICSNRCDDCYTSYFEKRE